MMPSVHSGLLRAASVSSIRRTKTPPCCRAVAQLYSAERAPPTWNMPVGLGAKRTRTGRETSVMEPKGIGPGTGPGHAHPAPGPGAACYAASRSIAFFARSTDSSAAGPPGFSVARAWLRVTKGRIRRS